jgi:hypothetical protein
MKQIAQWAALIALSVIGSIAFLVIIAEANPDEPLPLIKFLLLKAAAGVALYGCYKVGTALHRNGYLPEYLDKIAAE